jgi:hypothetical protein
LLSDKYLPDPSHLFVPSAMVQLGLGGQLGCCSLKSGRV